MKQHTMPYSLTLVLVFILSAATIAQGQADQAKNSLVAGAKALQFEINGDFDITSFQGTVISYKKQTSPGSATRVGLSLDLSVGDFDETGLRDDGATRYSRADGNRQSIRLALQRVFYSSPADRTSFFWGLGPFASFLRSESESSSGSTTATPVTAITNRKSDVIRWSAGAAILAGVELFLSKKVSLLAEYELDLAYTRSKRTLSEERFLNGTLTSGDDSESITKDLELSAQQVKFGVSVYFL